MLFLLYPPGIPLTSFVYFLLRKRMFPYPHRFYFSLYLRFHLIPAHRYYCHAHTLSPHVFLLLFFLLYLSPTLCVSFPFLLFVYLSLFPSLPNVFNHCSFYFLVELKDLTSFIGRLVPVSAIHASPRFITFSVEFLSTRYANRCYAKRFSSIVLRQVPELLTPETL